MQQLSTHLIGAIADTRLRVPSQAMLSLPEKVLQFGTGVLLRGLPDYFIDKANSSGVFNGRIVVVKSTGNGVTDAFARQDGLYTLLERGVVDGKQVDNAAVNASISRVISAKEDWNEVLKCAADPDIQIIISNTTEVGITLAEEDAVNEKPVSFPGRILGFLLERYRAFTGSKESGMVIIPTELIVNNGDALKKIVLALAERKGVSAACQQWISEANDFCNSLVDCIVPGKLPAGEQRSVEEFLGYRDDLMIMSEPYRLWAIETKSERTRAIVSFSICDPGVVLAPDINKFRELKLRLLNATHTLTCGLAHFAGFKTVKEAMNDEAFAAYLSQLMQKEIIPLVAGDTISETEATQFAQQVMDRFRNPYIEHLWLSITAQYTSKMAMRVAPLVEKYYVKYQHAPEMMALGFAAFLLFMKSEKNDDGYTGSVNGQSYTIQDDKALLLHNKWKQAGEGDIANLAVSDMQAFGADLSQHPGFAEEVTRGLKMLKQSGAANSLRFILAKKTEA